MKKTLYKLTICIFVINACLINVCFSQNGTAINTSGAKPDNSAIFDVSSTTSGMLIPRMTYAQRTNSASFNNNHPVQSLIVYQTDASSGYPEGFYFYSANNSPNWSFLANSTQVQNNSLNYAADNGTANTYQVVLSPPPISYTTGMLVSFKAKTANTGASTLNLNSLGSSPTIKKQGGATDLAPGDISAGQIVTVIYDGTYFQALNISSSGSGSFDPTLIYTTDGF